MCDSETKKYFRWGYYAQALILVTLIGIGNELIDIRDHTIASDTLHKQIPDGFFTQERWGLSDEREYQQKQLIGKQSYRQKLNKQLDVMDKQIALLDSAIKAHNAEAKIWKEMIRELAKDRKEQSNGYYQFP